MLIYVSRVLSDIDSLEEEKRVIQKVSIHRIQLFVELLDLFLMYFDYRYCQKCITS